MSSSEEMLRRRAANAAGGPRTFVCSCGHSYAEHTLARDSTPSAPRLYRYEACRAAGCYCQRFLSEYDSAQAAG
jgi:hypothetical protein